MTVTLSLRVSGGPGSRDPGPQAARRTSSKWTQFKLKLELDLKPSESEALALRLPGPDALAIR